MALSPRDQSSYGLLILLNFRPMKETVMSVLSLTPIVGYSGDDNMQTKAIKQALIRALRKRRSKDTLIHHSDRGSQHWSKEYQYLHSRHKIVCSMTDRYNCYQNALAERVNGILKMEYLLRKPKDVTQARRMVAKSIEIYNQIRPHTALKYNTPDEVHHAF